MIEFVEEALKNVGSKIMLVTMGYNIRKLLSLLDGNSLPSYWIAPKSLEPEIPRKFNIDKFIKNQKNIGDISRQ